MSYIATVWAWHVLDRVVNPTARLMLLKLAAQANDDGVSWPSRRFLARDLKVSDRRVSSAAKALEDVGLIERRMRRRQNGSQSSNVYQLLMAQGDLDAAVKGRGHSTDTPLEISDKVPPDGSVKDSLTGASTPEELRSSRKDHLKPSAPAGAVARTDAGDVVASFVDTLTARGVTSVPQSYLKSLGGIAKKLIDEGTPPELVVAAAVAAAETDRPPSALPGLILKVQTRTSSPELKRYGRGMTTEQMLTKVEELARDEG